MKKIFLLLLCSVLLAPAFFLSCRDNDDSDDSGYDVTLRDYMFGKYIQDIENYTGTFHYDEELSKWYAEDENHVRYYFVYGIIAYPIQGAEEGKLVTFSGELYSVSDRWLKDHEQYRQYKEIGLYVFDMDAPQCKYLVDGKTYPCQEVVE